MELETDKMTEKEKEEEYGAVRTYILKGMIENADKPIVICDLDYRIIYLNKMAKAMYQKDDSKPLLGTMLRRYFNEEDKSKLVMTIEWFKESVNNNKVFAFYDEARNTDVYIKAARNEDGELIGFYNYEELRSRETGREYDMD